MMLSLTKNTTTIFFNQTHRCLKHNALINLQHMLTCDYFPHAAQLSGYVTDLKSSNIRDWEEAKQSAALALFKETAETIQVMSTCRQFKVDEVKPKPVP